MITSNGALIIASLYVCGTTIPVDTIYDTSGAKNLAALNRSSFNFNNYFDESGTLGGAGMLMYFGSSDTAESASDTNLGSRLYGFATVGICGYDNGRLYVTATTTNMSGEDVTVREVGLKACTGIGATHGEFLIARKVIPARFVEDGETITYTFVINLAGA